MIRVARTVEEQSDFIRRGARAIFWRAASNATQAMVDASTANEGALGAVKRQLFRDNYSGIFYWLEASGDALLPVGAKLGNIDSEFFQVGAGPQAQGTAPLLTFEGERADATPAAVAPAPAAVAPSVRTVGTPSAPRGWRKPVALTILGTAVGTGLRLLLGGKKNGKRR